jgi:hypothetical protein
VTARGSLVTVEQSWFLRAFEVKFLRQNLALTLEVGVAGERSS